jgi:hypothetical protein
MSYQNGGIDVGGKDLGMRETMCVWRQGCHVLDKQGMPCEIDLKSICDRAPTTLPRYVDNRGDNFVEKMRDDILRS